MSSQKSPSYLSSKKLLYTVLVLALSFAAFFLFTETSRRNSASQGRISGAQPRLFVRESPPLSPFLIRRQTERVRFSRPEQLLKTLGIREGMKILDFGTGSGQYAYLFAKALNGTGVIYASDISPEKIHYVKQEIERQSIKNIEPVLTRGDKFDPFYERIKVDLIFMAHTHFYLENQEEYFSRLRASLNPRGRLALLAGRRMGLGAEATFFKQGDITDLPGLVTFLKQGQFKKGPFASFRSEVLGDISRSQGNYASEAVRNKIAEDFNRTLSSPLLPNAFYDERGMLDPKLNLLPDEKEFTEWLMRFLRDESPLLKEPAEEVEKKRSFCRTLINQILVLGQFRPFLFGGQSPYMPGANIASLLEEKALLSKLGYRLDGEYDFIPFATLLLFSLPQGEENGRIQNTKAS